VHSLRVTEARGRRAGLSDECMRVLRVAVLWPKLPLESLASP